MEFFLVFGFGSNIPKNFYSKNFQLALISISLSIENFFLKDGFQMAFQNPSLFQILVHALSPSINPAAAEVILQLLGCSCVYNQEW